VVVAKMLLQVVMKHVAQQLKWMNAVFVVVMVLM
jgi:hypothetical protein